MHYGEPLKAHREADGLKPPELALKLQTSQANISRWEKGDVLPSIDVCVRMADFYGISLDELVGRGFAESKK